MKPNVEGRFPGAAIYLRCYPFDELAMPTHQYALNRFADQLGLPAPTVFLDNGCPSRGPLPALEHVVDLAAAGAVRVVLVPGPFVFSLSDIEAHRVLARLGKLGCRVVELPVPHRTTNWRSAQGRPPC
ncbi:hypothetical protein GCM10010495_75980 [Kitasatospora herbaricolor]|nr:hypothetical protein [Kitasatospora herbaricolor]GGV47107.1 hypothetical protein GCM10010495_75980 [Kitasatospora herbaricolor]